MSYNDICIELLTNPNSPFKGHVWGNMSFVGLFYDFANLLAYGLSYLFKIFLDGMNNFAIGAYRFLSFSESSAVRSLYSLISKYVWIPILICGVIACFRIVLGGKNVGKQFIRNICILFVVTTLLPTLFNYINHDILGGYQKDETTGAYEDTTLFSHTLDTNDNKENQNSKKDEDIASLADTILRNNATDKIWLYDYAVKSGAIPDELDEKIKTMGDVSGTVNVMGAGTIEIPTEQYLGELTEKTSINNVDSIFSELKKSDARSEWLASKEAKILTFDNGADMFNSKLTEHIHNDWNSAQDSNYSGTNVPSSSDDNISGGSSKLDDLRTKYTEGVPNIYRLKAISTNSSETPYGIQRLSDGTNLLGATGGVYLGKESYWRYDIDWFNIFIEMLAHAYVFFVIGYCAIKLIIELIVHQIFGGVMAAMDLSGGDRIKKYLTAIIGCYMGLLISVMVIPLFNAGCNFITSNMGVDSGFIKAMLEIVLAMVIVNVPNIISMYFGINTGARAGMALFGTGAYLAGKAGRAVARKGVGAAKGIRNVVQTGAFTERGHRLDREMLQDARYRQGQENQRRQEQKRDAERAEDKQESAARESARQQENAARESARQQENAARESARQQENAARESARQQRLEQQNAVSNEQNVLRSNQDPNALAMERNADIANGRVPRAYDPVTYEKDQRMNSDILKGAQENGGTREAAKESASKYYSNHGVPSGVTPQTIEYSADKAYLHGQWDSINKEAKSMVDSGQARSYNEARVQVATNKLQEWGGTKENAERYVSDQITAEQLIPQRQNNSNLKT